MFAAYPAWRALAGPDPAGNGPPYGGQVTIDFGPHGWHEHLGAWSGPTEAAAFDAALGLIADLLAERVEVAVGLRGNRDATSLASTRRRSRIP